MTQQGSLNHDFAARKTRTLRPLVCGAVPLAASALQALCFERCAAHLPASGADLTWVFVVATVAAVFVAYGEIVGLPVWAVLFVASQPMQSVPPGRHWSK